MAYPDDPRTWHWYTVFADVIVKVDIGGVHYSDRRASRKVHLEGMMVGGIFFGYTQQLKFAFSLASMKLPIILAMN